MSEDKRTPLEVIADIGIPTDSYVQAIHWINDRLRDNQEWYEDKYNAIIGTEEPVKFATVYHAKFHFQYAVQEAIRAFAIEMIPDMERIALIVAERVQKLEEVQPWLFKDYSVDENAEPKLDAAGNPKPKKGAKKELALEVYNQEIKDKNLSRKEAIAILVDKVGLTSGGASTYYSNLKAGRF